jgi:hypothetical protein
LISALSSSLEDSFFFSLKKRIIITKKKLASKWDDVSVLQNCIKPWKKGHKLTLSTQNPYLANERSQVLLKNMSFDFFDKLDHNYDNMMSFKDVEAMLNIIF